MNAEKRRDLRNEKKTMQAVRKAVYASRKGSNLLSSVPAGTDEGRAERRKAAYKKPELKVGSIAWVNAKAREAGMTYGEYVGRSGI